MALTRTSRSTATRTGVARRAGAKPPIVVEGVDVLTRAFTSAAVAATVDASALVITTAEKAANHMRANVPVDEGNVLDSISADRIATVDVGGVCAEAGPDLDENPAAFVARYLENGTVKMSPRPFVGPAADHVAPDFERGLERLIRL